MAAPPYASPMSEPPPPLPPPPGWYPDPSGTYKQRYWDGEQWTEVRAPGRKPMPWWLVLILSLVGLAVAAWVIDSVLSGGHHKDQGAPSQGTTVTSYTSPTSPTAGAWSTPPDRTDDAFIAAPQRI